MKGLERGPGCWCGGNRNRLENYSYLDYFLDMKSAQPVSNRISHRGSDILGRSAATGHFIHKPASKGGSISMKEANTAVVSVISKKN
jgi:hypothetical protein